MILNNIKDKQKGFTIVELLVVIVVIGILAAITIVSYTGISARANTSANQQNASSVVAAAQAFYADNGAYPVTASASATVITNFNLNNTAKLPSGLSVTNGAVVAGSAITYVPKGTTGFCVGYWNYSGAGSIAWMYSGDATTGTSGTPSTCA